MNMGAYDGIYMLLFYLEYVILDANMRKLKVLGFNDLA